MRRPHYTAAARSDMLDIAVYIARESGSRPTAKSFVNKLRQRCSRLANLPGTLGTARPELGPDIRSVTERGYIIFFRYVANGIEIVSIVAGHRDIDRHFDETSAEPESPQAH